MGFPGDSDNPFLATSLNHQHSKVREKLGLPKDFVLNSFGHSMFTRLGEAGVDAFIIMRIAEHSSISVSQRYVRSSAEAIERAFERLESFNDPIVHGETDDVHSIPATISATPEKSLTEAIQQIRLIQ